MDYRLDEKGKYYTTRVTKRSAQILACAQGTLISGLMHLTLENRIKDELNSSDRFFAITNAQVREMSSGKLLYESQLLVLNKDQLNWVLPIDESNESSNPGHDTSGP